MAMQQIGSNGPVVFSVEFSATTLRVNRFWCDNPTPNYAYDAIISAINRHLNEATFPPWSAGDQATFVAVSGTLLMVENPEVPGELLLHGDTKFRVPA